MPHLGRLLAPALILVALLGTAASPVEGQAKAKHKEYIVTHERALSVSRMVLIRQGYTVVRVQRLGPTHVIYYRRGNNGRGKGKGPLQRMVIRTVRDRVLFEETDPTVLVDIDIKLKL
jgi:ribosomal protein L16/L10AE